MSDLPIIPTIDELTQNAATLLQQALVESETNGAALTASDIAIARSNQKALAFVQSVGLNGAYRYLRDHIAKQAIPTKSSGQYLNDWLDAYGIPRKEAQQATGPDVGGSGDAGATLSAGTILQRQNGLTYLVQADADVAEDGSLTVALTCTTAGVDGNAPAGEKLVLISTENGIDAEFTVGAAGIGGGIDQEKEVEAIYRLQQRLANPPRGSSPTDYERWALSVPGITRAWGIRNPSGPTTAGVIIMADNNPDGLPTEAQRQAVYDYIRDPERGPPDELFVIVPTPKYVDLLIQLSPNTAALRGAITLELQDLFYREVEPGSRLPLSHITEAVSSSPGEYNHALIEPTPVPGGFIFATAYEILVLRNVVFQELPDG